MKDTVVVSLFYLVTKDREFTVCTSDHHKIYNNVLDYRLKNDGNVPEDFLHHRFSFEEADDKLKHILKISQEQGSDFYCVIDDSVTPEATFLDYMSLHDIEEDENYGSVFSDFFVTDDRGKSLCLQKSAPFSHSAFPLVCFKTSALAEKIDEEKPEEFVLYKKLSKHIPLPLCSLNTQIDIQRQ